MVGMRVLMGVIFVVALFQPTPAPVPPPPVTQPVIWAGAQNVALVGVNNTTVISLRDFGACAFSKQQLATGDGYVEIKVTNPTADYVVSFGSARVFAKQFDAFSHRAGSMPYIGQWAAHFYPYGVEIREWIWLFRALRPTVKGSVVRLAMEHKFFKVYTNGVLWYTSALSAVGAYPVVSTMGVGDFPLQLAVAFL